LNNNYKRTLAGSGVLALAGVMAAPVSAQALDGAQLVQERCSTCHVSKADGTLNRISDMRKTPEGWLTSISRMQMLRGLVINADEKRAILKHLSDAQGLAPSEAAGKRYVLEQQPNVVEYDTPEYGQMCSVCHSSAKFRLERRTEQEWNRLVHFHVGQFPTIEYIAQSRDRPWLDIALNQTVPALAKDLPLENQAWDDWQAASKPAVDGQWTLTGYVPRKGEFYAVLTVEARGDDQYQLSLKGQYEDGTELSGKGSAVVYTGYEWRANLTIDGVAMRQVLAVSEDGQTLSGRQFEREATEIGGMLTGVKAGTPAIAAISPSYLRQGETRHITLTGTDLNGPIKLGNGVQVVRVVSRDAERVRLVVKADSNAKIAMKSVRVGSAKAELAVYDALARVDIVPAESIARIGGNGGTIPKTLSTYRAIGWAAGADGKPGTADDIRLGYMPASWSVKPFDEIAAHDKDVKYAGQIDASGVFTPGDAGLNPERKRSTNNAGNLAVVGTVNDNGAQVSGEAHLIVTAQDFMKSVIQ